MKKLVALAILGSMFVLGCGDTTGTKRAAPAPAPGAATGAATGAGATGAATPKTP